MRGRQKRPTGLGGPDSPTGVRPQSLIGNVAIARIAPGRCASGPPTQVAHVVRDGGAHITYHRRVRDAGVTTRLGRLRRKVMQALASTRADIVIVVVALLMLTPSLTTGYATDDHLHRVVLRDETLLAGFAPTQLDLFVFASGDRDDMHALMDRGVFPWTTDPDLKLAFFRPLSAATHLVDNALWPETPALSHLHSLLWFGALLLVIAHLYRRIQVAPWVAGLALLIYALDDVHAPTVGWIANRQAIISAVFGFLAVMAHHRARREDWRPGRWLAPAFLGLSLAAGESGIATVGYLVAHALALDPAPARARIWALLPHGLVVLTWGAIYVSLGYGARGSGLYIEPLASPLAFAAATATHLPVLLTGQLAGIWSEIYGALGPGAARTMVIVCIIYCLLLLDVLKVLLKVSAHARFWALGMVLSAVPICGTVPADRLLIFVGVGAAGLIACFIRAPEGEPGARSPSRVRRVSVRLWLFGLVAAHLVFGPLFLPLRALSMHTVGASLARADDTIPRDADITTRTVVAVNPPADPYMAFVPIMRASLRQPIPGRLRWLAVGQSDVQLVREDERTLLVRPQAGYLAMPTEQLVRDPRTTFTIGQKIALAGVSVEVTELGPDGRPAATRWRFERPLEDAGFVWLRWDDAGPGFVPFTPPAVGTRVTVPKVDTLRAFLGD